MELRIDKLLAHMGYGTRKEVKKLLKSGAVKVDGAAVHDAKTKVRPNEQAVTVWGEPVAYRPFIYLMMNKPPGVISATEDAMEETVVDLLEEEDRLFAPFPVGRLDKDTEGLLLLTNDGQLAHQLLSPKKHVPKTYFAVIDGEVTEADAASFRRGVMLDDGYETKPAELVILKSGPRSDVELTITEGKFHQVKRMFQAVGKRVVYLKRVKMGPLALDPDLAVGEYRELTDEEVEKLKQYRAGEDEKKGT
ncbi:RNA pseudouridine synthase [Geobacillus genomosp. 3]|uniref:Pseudouridine synthase n=1 Tax=Geobacillus genomosp. 3 TaxID=1921421 RepID=S6A3K0_GEOG3|nr:pseudouridine synthase [Geobacillus genomosp. 3]AGT33166.1 RNA pseudouridine synthase [Geobacillus genomosp. 3]